MANIFTTIQRKVNRGEFAFSAHSLDELDEENFYPSDAVQVILNPTNCYKLTEDESHIRYCFQGVLDDGRMLSVIIFVDGGIVKLKTVYEIF